jgi:hypothetical protein
MLCDMGHNGFLPEPTRESNARRAALAAIHASTLAVFSLRALTATLFLSLLVVYAIRRSSLHRMHIVMRVAVEWGKSHEA